MINSQEIKIGTCIRMDGKVWVASTFSTESQVKVTP